MLLKANKIIEKHIAGMIEKGFNNSYIIKHPNSNSDVVIMKLKETPISFIYGWKNDDDYWVISEN
jgi:hypothetical protein